MFAEVLANRLTGAGVHYGLVIEARA